jgi:RHS repeat-associated protein
VTDQYPAYKTYGYDTSNRLVEGKQYNSGGTLTNDWTYLYDSAGNRTKATATGATDVYSGYDAANELCWTKASSTTVSGSCASPPSGATTWTSNNNGDQTGNSAGLAYAYNAKGQTTSITPTGGSAVTYTYTDADQVQLTSRTLSGTTTTYDNTVLGIDRSTVGGTSTYTIRDNNGVALGTHTGSTSTYYLFDGQGSVRQTVKQDGTGLATVTYDPYGQQLTGTIPAVGFVGGQYDAATKLYKFGGRYDDSSLGRWTQPDPVPGQETQPESINRYAYAGNDPINNSDLSGRDWWNPFSWDWSGIACSYIATSTGVAIFTASTNLGIYGGFYVGGPPGAFVGGVVGATVGYVGGTYVSSTISSYC